jgi:hypothetical protein
VLIKLANRRKSPSSSRTCTRVRCDAAPVCIPPDVADSRADYCASTVFAPLFWPWAHPFSGPKTRTAQFASRRPWWNISLLANGGTATETQMCAVVSAAPTMIYPAQSSSRSMQTSPYAPKQHRVCGVLLPADSVPVHQSDGRNSNVTALSRAASLRRDCSARHAFRPVQSEDSFGATGPPAWCARAWN